MAGLLSRYLNTMIPIIETHGGIVEKLIGDSTLGIFRDNKDDIGRVLYCAIEMQIAMAAINDQNRKPFKKAWDSQVV